MWTIGQLKSPKNSNKRAFPLSCLLCLLDSSPPDYSPLELLQNLSEAILRLVENYCFKATPNQVLILSSLRLTPVLASEMLGVRDSGGIHCPKVSDKYLYLLIFA